MSEARRFIDRVVDRGPIPWAAAITVWAVPGILGIGIPYYVDRSFGDDDHAARWLEVGGVIWLTGLFVMIIISALGGYWLRRHVLRARGEWRDTDPLEGMQTQSVLATGWATALFFVFVHLGLDDLPTWSLILNLIAFGLGFGTELHRSLPAYVRGRRLRREQRAKYAKRSRRS